MADVRGNGAVGLRERKKQRTRTMLIHAAVGLCERQGFERTTVDQIAAIADVSPRTFSRYFPTKDAIGLALIDEALDKAAVELARQPLDLNPFEALRRAYVAMYHTTKSAPPGELSAERMLCIVRIVMTSPSLREAAMEYRAHPISVALAERMGVAPDDRKVKLVSSVWASLIMTSVGDLADENVDWARLSVDDIVFRVETTFAEFTDLMTDVVQPV